MPFKKIGKKTPSPTLQIPMHGENRARHANINKIIISMNYVIMTSIDLLGGKVPFYIIYILYITHT